MKKRGIKKSKKTLGKPSVRAQLKKNILNPRVGTGVLTNKITGGRTKLKGSPKTKFKIVKKSLKLVFA